MIYIRYGKAREPRNEVIYSGTRDRASPVTLTFRRLVLSKKAFGKSFALQAPPYNPLTSRLYFGVPGRLPRIVPESGATFNGHYLPAGVSPSPTSELRDQQRNSPSFQFPPRSTTKTRPTSSMP